MVSPGRSRSRPRSRPRSSLWWLVALLQSCDTNANDPSTSNTKPNTKPKPKPKRPNIIVMQPDDHLFLEEWNPPARFYGESSIGIATANSNYPSLVPNTNRLFRQGLELTNAYSSSTMCGTSRYSTLTGRLPSRSSYGRQQDAYASAVSGSSSAANNNAAHFAAASYAWNGFRNVVIPNTKLEDVPGWGRDCTEDNLAAVLKRHGYATGVVGKWHLGADDDDDEATNTNYYYDDDWTWYQTAYARTQARVRECGFDFAEAIYKENLDEEDSWTTNKDGGVVTHNMEHVTSEAIRFIEYHATGGHENHDDDDDDDDDTNGNDTDHDDVDHYDKPFFLYFNPTVPHHLADVTDALLFSDCKETVGGRLFNRPYIPYGMTADTDGLGCGAYRQSVLGRARAAMNAGNPLYASDHYFEYSDAELLDKLAGAVWIDDALGSLLQTLEVHGILNNTIVLFQLDHGMETKGSLFEGGSRIPQFVHYPDGFGTNRLQLAKPVATIDIAPTLMELAGISLVNGGGNYDDDGDGDDDEDDGVSPRYEMDGTSWASDAMDLASGLMSASTSASISARSVNDHERCLFVEEGLDRSVRCGCYKYIYVSDNRRGNTVRTAESQGMSLRTHNFYNLCDETTGEYLTSPDTSPELRWAVNNIQGIGQDIRDELKSRMECLLTQTDPTKRLLDFETDCTLPLFYDPDQEPVGGEDEAEQGVTDDDDETASNDGEVNNDDDDKELDGDDGIKGVDDDDADDENENEDENEDEDDDLMTVFVNNTVSDTSETSTDDTVAEFTESPSVHSLPTLGPTTLEIISTKPPVIATATDTAADTTTASTTMATSEASQANANIDTNANTKINADEKSKKPLTSTTKAVVGLASLLLVIAPFFFWLFYKEFCCKPKPKTGTVLMMAKDHSLIVGMGGENNRDCLAASNLRGVIPEKYTREVDRDTSEDNDDDDDDDEGETRLFSSDSEQGIKSPPSPRTGGSSVRTGSSSSSSRSSTSRNGRSGSVQSSTSRNGRGGSVQSSNSRNSRSGSVQSSNSRNSRSGSVQSSSSRRSRSGSGSVQSSNSSRSRSGSVQSSNSRSSRSSRSSAYQESLLPASSTDEQNQSMESTASKSSNIWEKLAEESKRRDKLREKINGGGDESKQIQESENTEDDNNDDPDKNNRIPVPESVLGVADGGSTDEASRGVGSLPSSSSVASTRSSKSKSSKSGKDNPETERDDDTSTRSSISKSSKSGKDNPGIERDDDTKNDDGTVSGASAAGDSGSGGSSAPNAGSDA